MDTETLNASETTISEPKFLTGAQAIMENASDVKIIFNDVAMESASHPDNAKTKIATFYLNLAFNQILICKKIINLC